MRSLTTLISSEAGVAEADAMKNDPNKMLQDIVWADVALKHCPDLYQLLYHVLSWDGTHTNINSINRHVVSDSGGEIMGLKIGPDSRGLVETLQAACLTFLWAAEPFARIFDKGDMNAQIHDQLHRSNELPQVEPTDPITAIVADRPRRDGRSQP